MSDERLRELERRWRATASVDDEGRLLLERVRVGRVERWRVALAAHCGHLPARTALRLPPAPSQSLREWVEGIARFGKEPLVRAALAAARFVYPIWIHGASPSPTQRHGSYDWEWVTIAVRATEAWVLTPSDVTAEAAREGSGLASDAVFEARLEADDPAALAAWSCEFAASVACEGLFEEALHAIRSAVEADPQADIPEVMADELVPWALGHYDPIKRWRT